MISCLPHGIAGGLTERERKDLRRGNNNYRAAEEAVKKSVEKEASYGRRVRKVFKRYKAVAAAQAQDRSRRSQILEALSRQRTSRQRSFDRRVDQGAWDVQADRRKSQK
jgi:hypothetical protein